MKLVETVYFNGEKYKTLHHDGISDAALQHKIEHKRKKKLAAKTKLYMSVAVLVYTAGFSSPATLHAMRTHSVRRQKVEVLEELWEERGHAPLPSPKRGTKIVTIGWMVLKEIVTLGMDPLDVAGQAMDAALDTSGVNVDVDDMKTTAHLHLKGKKQSEDKVGPNQFANNSGDHKQERTYVHVGFSFTDFLTCIPVMPRNMHAISCLLNRPSAMLNLNRNTLRIVIRQGL